MNSIKIIATGKYLPEKVVYNESIEKENNYEYGYIYDRTGIEKRHYVENQTLSDIAILSVEDMLIKNKDINLKDIDLIIATSTTIDNIMPSLSYKVQEYFNIKNCMCLDILAGCSGYINALDVAQKYLSLGERRCALVIGAEVLSQNSYLNEKDKILFGDGAGCIVIKECEEEKEYFSLIESISEGNDMLTCNIEHELYMNGKNVYKFATTKTVENMNKLLEKTDKKEEIKYVIPHQSNMRIIDKIAQKTKLNVYTNIKDIGNTFCASIPIALDDLFENDELKGGDKIILLGYGGGLNLGSILMEV